MYGPNLNVILTYLSMPKTRHDSNWGGGGGGCMNIQFINVCIQSKSYNIFAIFLSCIKCYVFVGSSGINLTKGIKKTRIMFLHNSSIRFKMYKLTILSMNTDTLDGTKNIETQVHQCAKFHIFFCLEVFRNSQPEDNKR